MQTVYTVEHESRRAEVVRVWGVYRINFFENGKQVPGVGQVISQVFAERVAKNFVRTGCLSA